MSVSSRAVSRPGRIVCPACGSGELRLREAGLAGCVSCGRDLEGAVLRFLEQLVALPDALGAHACECGYPEMRRLPDGVFHCPACGSEVLPVEVSGAPRQVLDGRLHRAPSGTPSPLEPTRRASA